MAITLPFPVRVAAGILATGIDVVRSLPEELPAIPVTLVGNAMKLSMKVQQEIATLATRGDELLGGVVGAPQENPSWAKFDDDEPAVPKPRSAPLPNLKPAPAATSQPAPAATPTPAPAATSKPAPAATSETDLKPTPATSPEPSESTTTTTTLTSTPTEAQVASATDEAEAPAPAPAADDVLTTPAETSVAPVTTTAMEAALEVPEAVVEMVIGADTDATPDDEPPALPGYDGMTLAQVRGHLRELTPDAVSALLKYEQDGDNRAPFLTLLSNRLVTLDAQNP